MGKSHYKATSFPKLHVMAVHKLLCLFDGFEIAGVLDDLRRARGAVGLVDKINAIRGHNRLLPTGGSITVLSVIDAWRRAVPVMVLMWGVQRS
jgi:hypothetical protein